jgi:hypothetical protein
MTMEPDTSGKRTQKTMFPEICEKFVSQGSNILLSPRTDFIPGGESKLRLCKPDPKVYKKQSQKAPAREIKTAERRMEEVLHES